MAAWIVMGFCGAGEARMAFASSQLELFDYHFCQIRKGACRSFLESLHTDRARYNCHDGFRVL